MQVKLSYVGYLKLPGVKSGSAVEVAEGATVADVLSQYGVAAEQQRHITPFVNGEERRHAAPLADGDELTLVIQIGGG